MKSMGFLKQFFQHKHIWLIGAYMIFYLTGFAILEDRTPEKMHLIHMPADDMIPFCEFFIIPYILWFFYITAVIVYFAFYNKNVREYWQLILTLAIGMTLFLIVSWFYPNGHDLRPVVFERDNIFVDMVKQLYKTDTSTNILPSIHVYNSVAVHIAVKKCRALEKNNAVQYGSLILSVLIILSTMFLKQHSILDVLLALLLNGVVYGIIYVAYETTSMNKNVKVKRERVRYKQFQ